jgi:hypothetical protein
MIFPMFEKSFFFQRNLNKSQPALLNDQHFLIPDRAIIDIKITYLFNLRKILTVRESTQRGFQINSGKIQFPFSR